MASFAPTALVLAAVAAPLQARDAAPLPQGVVDWTNRGEFEVYQPIPDQDGVFARGVSGGSVFAEIDPAREFCKGTAEERRAIHDRYKDAPANEYWYYGTATQAVLFVRSTRVSILPGWQTRECSRAIWVSLEIERAYVANGFVHSYIFDEIDTVPGLGSSPIGEDAGAYSGSFMRLASLMARREVPRGSTRGWSSAQIAGITAICSGRSGLVWSSTCYAAEGPVRGMLLSSGAGDDERQLFSNRIIEIIPRARLPGVLFEVDRKWRKVEEERP
jgi:hypothetical protein